jgi:hypothetical protein
MGTDPSASATGSVTLAMAGITPLADVTPPLATSAVVETSWVSVFYRLPTEGYTQGGKF